MDIHELLDLLERLNKISNERNGDYCCSLDDSIELVQKSITNKIKFITGMQLESDKNKEQHKMFPQPSYPHFDDEEERVNVIY